MKKKIIFVTKALWIGGIETALVNFLKHFDYNKYEVTLLILKAELDMLEQIHPKCRVLIADREKTVSFLEKYRYSRLVHLTEEPELPSSFHRMMMWIVPGLYWIENRLYIRYIRKLMQKEQFDVAVIYSDTVGEITVRAIKAKKYLMFYHHGAMRHVYHDKIAYRKCDKIITVSEHQAEKLKKFIPEYKSKVIVVNNMADVTGVLKKSREQIPENYEKEFFNIVTCGRISEEKGIDLVVQACHRLVADGCENIRWWIIGGGPAYEDIKKLISELDLGKYVYMLGMKENPYPYIAKADLYVQPSRFEGYPMSILEAVILKKIVISTNNRGAEEMLKDLKCGILCEIDSIDIAKKIEILLSNHKYYEEKERETYGIDLQQKNRNIMKQMEKLL